MADTEILELELDSNKAYGAAIKRLQKRIDDSVIPGSMLDKNDLQAVVDDMMACVFEFGLISCALNPSQREAAIAMRNTLESVSESVLDSFSRLASSLREVKFHEKPERTN